METLDDKRARLRSELQRAYRAWMLASEHWITPVAASLPAEASGRPDTAKLQWFAYLAAKDRLVMAYAERAATA